MDNSYKTVKGRIGLQQRVLPAYRAELFDLLATVCADGLSVFAGEPLAAEEIPMAKGLRQAEFYAAENRHLFDPSSSMYLCWQKNLIQWLEDWNPEVLIVEANPRYVSTRQAIRWMKKRGRPVIGWGLGAPKLSGKIGTVRQWERRSFLSQLDGMVAYSKNGAKEYIQMGFAPERVFVAANAVMRRPDALPPERSTENSKPLTVLFVGRLQARKRVEILLEACSQLPEEYQPELVIVGDGPAREEFERVATAVYPKTRFTGAREGVELEAIFRNADLFVLPGTGGLAVQQAMGYALPVIVAAGDGTQNDLVRENNGWLVPTGDVEALRDRLAEALSNPDRLRRMGMESYRIVNEEVNLEAMVSTFVRALRVVSGEEK